MDRAELRELAARHRWAIVSGVANAVGGMLLGSGALPPSLGVVLSFGAGAFVMIAVYRLARMLYGVGTGVLCAISMIVPVVWIGVLIVLGSRTSKQLRAAGVRVGFFGADPATI